MPMARPLQPLFSLLPLNSRAEEAVLHGANASLRSSCANGTIHVLDVGVKALQAPVDGIATLATLGHSGAPGVDIVVAGPGISKVHCAFELHGGAGAVVMLHDKSMGWGTGVSCQDGERAVPFDRRRGPRVVVMPGLNTVVTLGTAAAFEGQAVKFKLVWREPTPAAALGAIEQRLAGLRGARESAAARPAPPPKPDLVPGTKYYTVDRLGSSLFGGVSKAVDVYSGRSMAVRVLKRSASPTAQVKAKQEQTEREVKKLCGLRHIYMVDYLHARAWDSPAVEIFMDLQDGSLRQLMLATNKTSPRFRDVCDRALRHALSALDFCAAHGVVHRNVTPDTLLYHTRPDGTYGFRLGDFRFPEQDAAAPSSSSTRRREAGAQAYTAPEVARGGPHTHASDTWSLFVTMAWATDTDVFARAARDHGLGPASPPAAAYRLVLHAANTEAALRRLRPMAVYDEARRASAARLLKTWYAGQGMATDPGTVSPLGDSYWRDWVAEVEAGKSPYADEIRKVMQS